MKAMIRASGRLGLQRDQPCATKAIDPARVTVVGQHPETSVAGPALPQEAPPGDLGRAGAWAINGALRTANASHRGSAASGHQMTHCPACPHSGRDLPSWPCEFDSRHPLHIIAPNQLTFSVPGLFEHRDDKNN